MKRPFDVPARMRTAGRECRVRRFGVVVVVGGIDMAGRGRGNGMLWIGRG